MSVRDTGTGGETRRLVGRSDDEYFKGQRDRRWWIGKPWRRIEATALDFTYKGVTSREHRGFTITLGWPHFGWFLHVTVGTGQHDYGEETP